MQDKDAKHSAVQPGRHFRLRIGTQIVGYMNIREPKRVFFSADNASWSTRTIDYDHKDRSTEILDANRAMVFEHDMVQLRREPTMNYTKRGLVVWHNTYRTLVVKLIEEDGILELDAHDHSSVRDDLTVISHLF